LDDGRRRDQHIGLGAGLAGRLKPAPQGAADAGDPLGHRENDATLLQ